MKEQEKNMHNTTKQEERIPFSQLIAYATHYACPETAPDVAFAIGSNLVS